MTIHTDLTGTSDAVTIGVAVAVFDQERFIEACLRSVAAQEGVEFRCIVVDDGSSDSSPELVEAFCAGDDRFSLIRRSNTGVAGARNTAMAAFGDGVTHLCFLDGDDQFRPGALRRLADAAVGHVGAHGLAEFVDVSGQPIEVGVFPATGRQRYVGPRGFPRRLGATAPSTFESVMIATTVFPSGVVLARRDTYEHLGGFDQRLFPAEDVAVVIGLCRSGDLAFVDDVVVDYRRHGNNESGRPQAVLACHRVLTMQHVDPANSREQERSSRRAYRARQILDATERTRRIGHELRRGHFVAAAGQTLRLPLRAGRWLRGRPSAREIAEARRWAAGG